MEEFKNAGFLAEEAIRGEKGGFDFCKTALKNSGETAGENKIGKKLRCGFPQRSACNMAVYTPFLASWRNFVSVTAVSPVQPFRGTIFSLIVSIIHWACGKKNSSNS